MMLIVVVISILSLAFILDSTVFRVLRVDFISVLTMSIRKEIEDKIENYAKRLESFNNDNDGNTTTSHTLTTNI